MLAVNAMLRTFLLAALTVAIASGQSDPCPANAMLDVSDSPGAGPAYPAPRVEATCEGGELVVR